MLFDFLRRTEYPKRIGQVFQTRYYVATGKAGPALASGSKFAGTITAGGQRLAEGLVTLKEPLSDLAPFGQRPIVNLLHYPRLAVDKQDKPPIHELVENVPPDVKIEQAWIGAGFRSANPTYAPRRLGSRPACHFPSRLEEICAEYRRDS